MWDWEESIGQQLSKEEDSFGQEVPKGNGNRPSVQSGWEDDNNKELKQDSWGSVTVHSTGVKPLLWEEDEWGEVSILELCEEEAREQRLGGFAGDGLPVPVPQEAWAEHRASEPCPQGPLCALPPHVEAQALGGHAASLAREEQGQEAETESPVPPPCSCPSPSAPQL